MLVGPVVVYCWGHGGVPFVVEWNRNWVCTQKIQLVIKCIPTTRYSDHFGE